MGPKGVKRDCMQGMWEVDYDVWDERERNKDSKMSNVSTFFDTSPSFRGNNCT